MLIAGQSSPLSPFAKDIYSGLLTAAARQDQSMAEGGRLQLSCFEAVNDMVRATTADVVDTVSALVPIFLQEISRTLEMPTQTGEAREKQRETQAMYCSVLMVSKGFAGATGLALVVTALGCVLKVASSSNLPLQLSALMTEQCCRAARFLGGSFCLHGMSLMYLHACP